MFARKYRLPYYIQFQNSASIHTPSLTIRLKKNNLGHNRYGVIIGKKIDKRATVRNKLKRRVRSCLEALHPRMKPGYDMIVLISKNTQDPNFCEEITRTCKNQSIL